MIMEAQYYFIHDAYQFTPNITVLNREEVGVIHYLYF